MAAAPVGRAWRLLRDRSPRDGAPGPSGNHLLLDDASGETLAACELDGRVVFADRGIVFAADATGFAPPLALALLLLVRELTDRSAG